ncbi:MAG TPA: hypothetical protein VNV41_16435 [Candidatus Acidoferrales bacterium]|jgi:hypothetical protein|nr:hypothetical protein [Candidatus Acidoferrales bacterium]
MSTDKNEAPLATTLSPELMAAMNAQTSAAVAEAVKGIFAGLAPVLKDLQMTPEKLAALKAPYVDPAVVARELRETANSKAQEDEIRKMTKARQASCLHIDKNGKTAICLIHNFPDRQPRGICPLCHDIIHPRQWVIDAPDPKTGKAQSHIEPAHKDYRTVEQLESVS